MPTRKLHASLAFINIPSDNPDGSRDFFAKLFGIDMAEALHHEEGWHAPISDDGIDINITIRHTPQESAMPFIAVHDLDHSIGLAEGADGQVVWGPEHLEIPEANIEDYKQALMDIENIEVENNKLGRAVIILEPGGTQVGLVELEEHAHRHFNMGEHQQPLSDYRIEVHERSMAISRNQSEE
jgi:predicted enzyme related to lactoylglutathione lyase